MRLIPVITKFFEIVTIDADNVREVSEVFENDVDRSGPVTIFYCTRIKFHSGEVDLPVHKEMAERILAAPLEEVRQILRSGYEGRIHCRACSKVDALPIFANKIEGVDMSEYTDEVAEMRRLNKAALILSIAALIMSGIAIYIRFAG